MSKTAPTTREERILAVLKKAERERDWLARHPAVLEPYRGQLYLRFRHPALSRLLA